MPFLNQPMTVMTIDADAAITVVDATNSAPGIMDAGQAESSVNTHGPAAIWVNQILRIGATDVQKWTSHLDSTIRLKSWETL